MCVQAQGKMDGRSHKNAQGFQKLKTVTASVTVTNLGDCTK